MTQISHEMVLDARTRISAFVHRTPIHSSATLNAQVRAEVFLKCENFQKTGSFKFRGASNAVSALSEISRADGVYAHSSGNHAQALALAAQLHGVPSFIVMPENSNPTKVAATKSYGAHVTFCEPTHEARWQMAERIGNETGATFVHPHNDPNVIAGQGTACLELIEELGTLDLILAPVGGGGLLSGTLLIAKHMLPEVEVIGCEPEGADDAARGLEKGERILDFVPNTIADGLRTPLGDNTFEIISKHADRIERVSESEIVQAMRFVWERMKLLIEPSSAVAVAPLLNGLIETAGRRVGVIISGGNVDVNAFFHLLEASI